MDRLLTVSLTAVEVCCSVERLGHGPTVDSVADGGRSVLERREAWTWTYC